MFSSYVAICEYESIAIQTLVTACCVVTVLITSCTYTHVMFCDMCVCT